MWPVGTSCGRMAHRHKRLEVSCPTLCGTPTGPRVLIVTATLCGGVVGVFTLSSAACELNRRGAGQTHDLRVHQKLVPSIKILKTCFINIYLIYYEDLVIY